MHMATASSELIVSVSGIRGIIGAGLSPGPVVAFAQALGTYLKGGRVVLSRDSRPSGLMMRHAVVRQNLQRRSSIYLSTTAMLK